jgi:hypothetical protein
MGIDVAEETRMRARPALSLAMLLLVGGAAHAKQSDVTVGRSRKAGERADVYDGTHAKLPQHTLVKIPKPGIFVYGQYHHRSDALMQEHAARTVRAIGTLGADPKSGAFFRRILPEAAMDAELPGWLFMTPRDGVPLGRLSGAAAQVARGELSFARGEAQRILGTGELADDHFLFDLSTGKMTGWTAPFHQPNGTAMPYDLVGLAGEGRNSDAFLIKNHVPGQSHLVILKVARPYSRGRGTRINAEPLRDNVAQDVAYLATTLRDRFKVELGHPIIPETIAAAPGVLLQEAVDGVSVKELSGERGEHGVRLFRRAQALALQWFPKSAWSDSKSDHHVLFDRKTGLPNGWYDFLSDNQAWVKARP